jgi:metal-sulfur cluster biosynthetic enzyme
MAGHTPDTETDIDVDAAEPSRSSAESEEVSREAVLARLDRVTDPELDRSIVELEYIEEIAIDGSELFVRFALPTAWCSPTFAWMMAVDIREESERLAGIEETEIELIDHMHTAEINAGVNSGKEFEDAFEDATGGIEETRRSLDRKARLARQYRAVDALLDAGIEPGQIVSLTPEDVGFADLPQEGRAIETGTEIDEPGEDDDVTIPVAEGAFYVRVPRAPIAAYLAKAIETDLLASSDDPLFATPDGEPIEENQFDLVHHRARAANVNQSGQGGVCASLQEARYGSEGNGGEMDDVGEPADRERAR